MLPHALARLSSQLEGNQLVLHYLSEQDQCWLRALIDEYEAGVGAKRSELFARLREPLPVRAPKAKQRWAVEVLQRLTEGRAVAAIPPREARWAAFTTASSSGAPRDEVLANASLLLGTNAQSLEAALFADLRSESRASALPAELSPEQLALDANLRLVSSWMLRARRVHLSAWGNTRALVRQARLHGLICTVRRAAPTNTASAAAEGVELEISGPLALFRHTLIYGRALSALIPRALWCHRFELRAECETSSPAALATVTVRSGDPLRPSRELAQYDSRLEARFAKDFRSVARDWNLVREPRPVESLGSLIFPDFELVHRHDGARRWLLEIIGFWTPKYLEEKLRHLRAAGLENVILCIDQERACSEAELVAGAKIIRFKRRIDVQAVLAAL